MYSDGNLKNPNLDLSQLKPETLERQLGILIGRYVRIRSKILASAVVSHIEALCAHPDYDGDPEQRCNYRRLARHWRWLAGCDSTTDPVPSSLACVPGWMQTAETA